MANVVVGEGTTFAYSADGTSFTTVAQVVSVDGPGWTVEAVDKTHLGSTDHEFRPSNLGDAGEISISILYDPDDSSHQALTTLMVTPAERTFRITFTDSTPATWTAAGFLTGFSPNGMEVESNLGADCSIKLTGAITIA